MGYDWSIKAGDEAVIFVMDLFMLGGGLHTDYVPYTELPQVLVV